MILPYRAALDGFLAIMNYLPQPFVSFINANLLIFGILSVYRRFLHG